MNDEQYRKIVLLTDRRHPKKGHTIDRWRGVDTIVGIKILEDLLRLDADVMFNTQTASTIWYDYSWCNL